MKWMIVAVVAILMSGTSATAQAPPAAEPAEAGRGRPSPLRHEDRRDVLGPRKLLDPALTRIAADTAVEVTASKVTPPGQSPFYLAASVKVGDKQYKLRDEQGRFLDREGKPVSGKAKRR